MSRTDLCALLALPDDASIHAIRARAARVASGKPELGSSPSMRRVLADALRLMPGVSDIAILRVIESILAPHPLSRARREYHRRVIA